MAKGSNGKSQQQTELVQADTTQHLPAYLQSYGREGLGNIGEYQSTPRLKVLQAQTKDEIKKDRDPGHVITMPDMCNVAKYGEPFAVNLLYWWPSWMQWRDVNDRSGGPVIAETLDKASEIALAALDPEKRKEAYGEGGFRYTFCEALNFAMRIEHECESRGVIVVSSWMRGGHRVGRRLAQYLNRRGVPIWSVRLALTSSKVTNAAGQSWYQLDFAPADPSLVSEYDVEKTRAQYEEIRRAHESATLGVNRDDAVDA